ATRSRNHLAMGARIGQARKARSHSATRYCRRFACSRDRSASAAASHMNSSSHAPSMSLDRAWEIVASCAAHVWFQDGADMTPPPSLEDYSLQELLDANQIVRNSSMQRIEGGTILDVSCDDRLVAALYVLYHYRPDDLTKVEPIVIKCDSAVGVFK